ncbi:FG-GAP repeat protein [Rubripirellula amarantea]|uniref:FG-GAP repeat protein n=1 Tax=Rubripirellula amarantea TaxID=2527999 RepID=A0A5C5WSI5_9BACT|nr:PVC-type heme-binding CxxCH protein [Rubripirellula amarantea]TWT53577.1 FG-GAP repeat protein [Rubripirellula amarantea]
MTKTGIHALLLTLVVSVSTYAQAWNRKPVHQTFYSEGASAGDIDGDGITDLVAGPLWFRGPSFEESFEIAPARQFPISSYSDQFFSHVFDANADGHNDVLVIGFPGQAARLYLNPGPQSLDQAWALHEVADVVDNESPSIVDLVPGGLPEIVCGRESRYGYYEAGTDPTLPWTWHGITRAGACSGRFEHGMGVGDVNSDGRMDLLNKTFWWEQPSEASSDELWQPHRWAPQPGLPGGAQICVDDLDDDGDADIVSSLSAHGHGLAWFEQIGDGEFVQHDIMGDSSTDNDYGVVFSQLHAVVLADVNSDGRKDIVTGKRWMAHNGHDVGGLQEPVLYWFENVKADQTHFVPHLIDNDSGVGTDILVADLDGDQRLDVVSASKRGLTVHLQNDLASQAAPTAWRQSEGRDQSKYANGLSPEQAAEQMLTDDGFTVDVVAAEPELTQPIAMCFDARGRIWVIEGHTYPTKAPEGQGRDRVIILEDTDSDGAFETKTTFIEGINLASGIEVGFGGVWIGAAPELLFIPDADHDGKPDGPPQVLLNGWGYQDTHETLNSFTWGPDGWLYGCHGVFTHSEVGKPGSPPSERVKMNAGVWRYHPTQHRFEVYAHGTSNPWGVDFNDQGDWFISACVIPHLYHMIQGGRYQRQGGQHFNAATYDDIKTIADHAHFAGRVSEHAYWGDMPIEQRSTPLDTSVLGGGHAHCGLAIYNADVFPLNYRQNLFFHNLHGHRVVQETLVRDGSGYVGLHQPDFALARDHKQIGVGIMVGPDGALYTSDWYDIQTCHNRDQEVWDRTDGRLYRIRYGDIRPQSFDLWSESTDQLVERLRSNNGFFARQAQRVLSERAAASLLVDSVAGQLARIIDDSSLPRDRLRAVWTYAGIGAANDPQLIAWMNDRDPYVRGWAVQLAGEAMKPLLSPLLDEVAKLSKSDKSLVVQRYIVSLLQRIPVSQRWQIVKPLLANGINPNDRNLPFLVWYALEPMAVEDPARAMELAETSGLPSLFRFAVRRVVGSRVGRDTLMSWLSETKSTATRALVLTELIDDAKRRGGVTMPDRWPERMKQLSLVHEQGISNLARELAIQYGDESVFPYLRERLADRSLPKSERLSALSSLRSAGDAMLPKQVFALLDDASVSTEAVAALASFDDPAIADKLLQSFPHLTPAAKLAAMNWLSSRKATTERLVHAMESQVIEPKSVPAYIVRQAVSWGDPDLLVRIERSWGRIASSSQEKQSAYKKYRSVLTPPMIAKANASAGRSIFEANCGTCHRLFGEGGMIGPDITGANRTSVDYWLENILEPNALIGRAYQMTKFLTTDGRVIAGIVNEENEDAITVQTATEKIVLPVDEIEERSLSEVSMMPEGQLQPMSDDQVRSLFKYLMSPHQVKRPNDHPTSASRPKNPNTTIVEAETIKNVEASGGQVRSQAMKHFGNDWSGDQQLWWTGADPSQTLTLNVVVPTSDGNFDVSIFFTQARDYAIISVGLDDQEVKQQDFYSGEVTMGPPMTFADVSISSERLLPLKITIVGKNDQAVAGYMVGIDRIEFTPSQTSN